MKKRIWDLYAPIYKRAMKAGQRIYDFMYERIPAQIKGKGNCSVPYSLRPAGRFAKPSAARATSAQGHGCAHL